MRSLTLGTALLAWAAFGFQSVALPIHAAAHTAAQLAESKASVPSDDLKTPESECELCSLASQLSSASLGEAASEASESVNSLEAPVPASPFVALSTPTPPARAPPSVNATGL